MHSRLGDIYMKLDKLDKALAEYHRCRLSLPSLTPARIPVPDRLPVPASVTVSRAAVNLSSASVLMRSLVPAVT